MKHVPPSDSHSSISQSNNDNNSVTKLGGLRCSSDMVCKEVDCRDNHILPTKSSLEQSDKYRVHYVSSDMVSQPADCKENSDFLFMKGSTEPQPPKLEDFSTDVITKQKGRILATWPTTTPHAREVFPKFCKMYERIKETGLPNFLGAKIPVDSDLVISNGKSSLNRITIRNLYCFSSNYQSAIMLINPQLRWKPITNLQHATQSR